MTIFNDTLETILLIDSSNAQKSLMTTAILAENLAKKLDRLSLASKDPSGFAYNLEETAALGKKHLKDLDNTFKNVMTPKSMSAQSIIDSMDSFGSSTKMSADDMNRLRIQVEQSDAAMRKMQIQQRSMERLGPMFAFLFGGMALQRIGLSITRFVLPAMDKVNNYVSQGTKKVMSMNASFEFLKFTIFETFTQTPLFRAFVEATIELVNWLSQLVSKYPIILDIVAGVGAIATILGSLSIGAGLFYQFDSMYDYVKKGDGKIIVGLRALGAELWLLARNPAFLLLATAAALFAGSISAAYDKFPELKQAADDSMSSIKDALASAVASVFDLFDVSVDTTDALWVLGNTGNLAIIGFATAIVTAIGLVELLVRSIKLAGDYVAIASLGFQKLNTLLFNPFADVSDLTEQANAIKLIADEDLSKLSQGADNTGARINALNSNWQTTLDNLQNGPPLVATSIQDNLIDSALPNLSSSINGIGTTTQNEIIDRWENWTPSTKTLKIKVEQSGSANYSPINGKTYSSSITGGLPQ